MSTDDAALLADLAGSLKDFARRELPRYTTPIELPRLDDLDLPKLAAGDALPSLQSAVDVVYHRPDGTAIGTLKTAMKLGEPIEVLLLALSVRRWVGLEFQVSTCFFPTSLQTTLVGLLPDMVALPLLWETAVFQANPGKRKSISHAWRYAGRAAALAGHRRVVAELRQERLAHTRGLTDRQPRLDHRC